MDIVNKGSNDFGDVYFYNNHLYATTSSSIHIYGSTGSRYFQLKTIKLPCDYSWHGSSNHTIGCVNQNLVVTCALKQKLYSIHNDANIEVIDGLRENCRSPKILHAESGITLMKSNANLNHIKMDDMHSEVNALTTGSGSGNTPTGSASDLETSEGGRASGKFQIEQVMLDPTPKGKILGAVITGSALFILCSMEDFHRKTKYCISKYEIKA